MGNEAGKAGDLENGNPDERLLPSAVTMAPEPGVTQDVTAHNQGPASLPSSVSHFMV